jgi:hypothetical protein
MPSIQSAFKWSILSVFTVIVLSFALKIAQVGVLSGKGVLYEKQSKTLITNDKTIEKAEAREDFAEEFIDYRGLSGFQIALTGVLERIDDLSFWHLTMLCLALYLAWKAFRHLPDSTRQELEEKPFLSRRDLYIAGTLVFISTGLYFFAKFYRMRITTNIGG